jgi:hypothetical protein
MSDDSSMFDDLSAPKAPQLAGTIDFEIEANVRRHYYTAASHRPLIRSIQVRNRGYKGDAEELMVSVRAEAVGAPSLLQPWRRMYPMVRTNDSVDVDVLTLRPNMLQLAALDELVRGDVIISVSIEGDEVATARYPVEFLAYNEWMHVETDYESFSAFVLPNHPVVTDVMIGARKRLASNTGDGATEGYQLFNPKFPDETIPLCIARVHEFARAIYEELQSRGLKYSNPPASFEGYGQRIRTPDVIFRDQAMTCLDSTVLVASCLASAGVAPLLFLVKGHAFPGFWTTPLRDINEKGQLNFGPSRPAITSNVNKFQILANQKLIGSFESTKIGDAKLIPFSETIDRHVDYLSGTLVDTFEGAVDVERAAELGVRRLANRVTQPGSQEITIVEDATYPEPTSARPDDILLQAATVDAEKLSKGDVPPRVRKWMDALLDLSNSNPLITLDSDPILFLEKRKSRSVRAIKIPINDDLLGLIENKVFDGGGIRLVNTFELPSALLNQPSSELAKSQFESTSTLSFGSPERVVKQLEHEVEKLIALGETPQNANVMVTRGLSKLHSAEATRRFRALKKYADAVEAESATNQLFITIGSLIWESQGDLGSKPKLVKSPLFIIPVRVTGNAQSGFVVQREEAGELSPNYCLLEKLRHELGLRIEELETPNLDESGIDVDGTITRIRMQLSRSKFAAMRVEADCQLAVLDFANFRMWNDIKENWRLFARNVVVNHLIEGTSVTLEQDLPIFSKEALTPFDCDESQLKAVQWALEGRSFVLEGPPGTGKSQTIANIIAAGMAEGKRILFVAEKQVALEAVSRKLDEIGLDPFCITMHHESTTPESIRRQLQTSLDFVGRDVKAEWDSETTRVADMRSQLDKYHASVVEPNSAGSSALTATQEAVRIGEGAALPIDTSSLRLLAQHLADVRSALLGIRRVAGVSRIQPEPAWSLAVATDPNNIPKSRLADLLTELQSLVVRCSHLHTLIEGSLLAPNKQGLTAPVKDAMRIASGPAPISLETATTIASIHWMSRFENLQQQIEAFKSAHSAVIDFFSLAAFEMDVTPQITAASEAISAGVFKKKKKNEILRGLVAPLARKEVTQEPAELLTLLQRIAPAREALSRLKEAFTSTPHVKVRQDINPLNPAHVDELVAAAKALQLQAQIMLFSEARAVRELIATGTKLSEADIATLDRLLEVWCEFVDAVGGNQESLKKWVAGRTAWAALSESLPIWAAAAPTFDTLSRLAAVHQILTPLTIAGQSPLVDAILSGDVDLDSIYEDFDRGFFRACRDERLQSGELAKFSQPDYDKIVANFTVKHQIRRVLMATLIPRQLSESRPFKPGVRTGAIGQLERELGRKVRRVSIPKLIKEHGEMITRLTPCFLMSPEAVSRLLPADSQFFDLVIFDEASQVRVAAAIPAMGRGRAVLVVGDSKQMPPSKKIGQRQVDSESEATLESDGILKDLESILSECSESHLPSLMLQCHFRSQHEGLIAFSNRNFYASRLVTFPAPNTDRTTPISWIDVPDGEFLRKGEGRGTNPPEAIAVVAEIKRRLNSPEHASKSIGVVTFNEFQADCISELLEEVAKSDSAVHAALNNPKRSEQLFVVPLEKVQGDERDTIILSVSYSYQGEVRDKVSPTWGPLTYKGGERRLNVAITRAKKDLVVVCSFDPHHVSTKGLSHDGVRATVEFLKECRAASKSNGAALKSRSTVSVDHFRRQLFAQLRDAGINVRENVGLSKFRIDLAIADKSGEQQFLALLLDNEEWASRTTPYDREILPGSVLRIIGWRRIGRVWLKSAVKDPDLVLRTVRTELTREMSRESLMQLLRDEGYEVRDDSALSRVGIDFAIRQTKGALWPLAVSLTGSDLFTQYFTYAGDVPPEDVLRSVRCVRGVSLLLSGGELNVKYALDKVHEEMEKALHQIEMDGLSDEEVSVSPTKRLEQADTPESDTSSASETEHSPLTQSEMWSEFLDARSLPQLGNSDKLGPGDGYDKRLVKRAIDEVVELEGPIMEERLASIVAGRFGMMRVKATRLNSMKPWFSHLSKTATKFGVVYWPSSRPADTWKGFRTSSTEQSRSIEEVPAEELSNAMIEVVRMGDSATEEEILRYLSTAFQRKLTEKVRTLLSNVLSWTASKGQLTLDGTFYKLPTNS